MIRKSVQKKWRREDGLKNERTMRVLYEMKKNVENVQMNQGVFNYEKLMNFLRDWNVAC